VPLGHQLGADDDIRLTCRNRLDPLLQRAGGAEHVRAEHRDAGLGKTGGGLFGQPLDTRTNRGEPPLGAAMRTGFGDRLGLAALVAHQPFQEPVFDHARIAMVTADLLPAGPAQRDRGIAAPVEEKQRLFPLGQPVAYRPAQVGRDPAGRLHRLGPHVDGLHLRQHRRTKTRGQLHPFVFARIRIGPAFQRGRGAGQHHPRAADRRAQHRHVTRIIEYPVLLLVGGVVFLIHDDQAQVAERQEQRRARAHHQLRRALPHHAPDAAAFGHGRARMPFGGPRPEPRLDPAQELGRQSDLGQQHQRLPAHAQRLGHCLQIDLGLAGTGDALEQRGAVAPAAQPRAQAVGGADLILGQRLAGQIGVEMRIGQIARAVLFPHGALFDQPLDH